MVGFFAVAWTDLLQGIIRIGTLVIRTLAGFLELQGSEYTLSDDLLQIGESNASFTMGRGGLAAVSVILGGLSWGLGYL